MKKFLIVFVAAMALVSIYFLKNSPERATADAVTPGDQAPPVESGPRAKPALRKPVTPKHADVAPEPVAEAKLEAGNQNQSGDKTIIHTTADFEKGQFDNTA